MKSLLLLIAVLAAVTLSSSAPSGANGTPAKKQRSTIRFDQPVQLQNATLKGEYLFVHDDAAMARGEACTFVYKGTAELPDNLVASFHCQPAERAKASHFTVRTEMRVPGVSEISEYQFAGSTEGHLVPLGPHGEHINSTSVN